jgi:hypothetical protein
LREGTEAGVAGAAFSIATVEAGGGPALGRVSLSSSLPYFGLATGGRVSVVFPVAWSNESKRPSVMPGNDSRE